jgi:hypothetical protein
MTYGHWMDQAQAHLSEACRQLRQVGPAEIVNAAAVVAQRDECLRQLNRLALLLGGVPSRGGSPIVAASDTLAAGAVNDPAVSALLRALPAAVGIASGSDAAAPAYAPGSTAAAATLRSAALAVSPAVSVSRGLK